MINSITEYSGKVEITESFRNTRINTQSIIRWLHAQNCLRQIPESPCSSACQPAVFCLTVEDCVSTCNHLGIYIWFCTVDLTDIFDIGRAGFLVNFKSSVSTSDHGFCNRNPWVIVTEDTGVFFISRRVRGNFSKVQIILRISRLKDHNTIFGIQMLFNRIQSLFCEAFFYTDSCHNTESLRLDKNLTFFAFFGTDFLRFCIICTDKPFSIPACIQNCLVHGIDFFFSFVSSFGITNMTTDFCKFSAIFYKHTCNKYRFCNWSLRRSCSLERLSGLCGETVQI